MSGTVFEFSATFLNFFVIYWCFATTKDFVAKRCKGAELSVNVPHRLPDSALSLESISDRHRLDRSARDSDQELVSMGVRLLGTGTKQNEMLAI